MKKFLLPAALAVSMAFFACGSQAEKKHEDGAVPQDTSKGISAAHDALHGDSTALAYICPCGGCPEIRESQPGKCSKCQMELVEEKK